MSCVFVQPLLVGMAVGDLRLDLLVGDDAALLDVDQQHLAGLQPPLGDDVFLGHRQHAGFRRHDDAVVIGDDVAGRPQAVAVERGADLPAVGEGDRRRPVPRLHQRGVVFVESLAVVIHELVAGPGFRDQHHHGVAQRIAALPQEFERIVEAGGVRLALIGDRPQLRDVLAEQRGLDRRLPRRHPVDVAAQRVDLAIVGDHAIGMRQLPRREGVGREALVDQRQRALEARVGEILVVGRDLVGEEHALVDDGARRHRHGVEAVVDAVGLGMDARRDHLAQDVEPALELVFGRDVRAAADEHLPVERLGRGDVRRRRQRGIVDRHVAEAEQRLRPRRASPRG